jgi:hypothetical protein
MAEDFASQLTADENKAAVSRFVGEADKKSAPSLDWVLGQHDKKTTEPQSLEEELRRLQVLKSYLILDSEREPQFERLTAFGSRILDVPICLGKIRERCE